MKRWIGILFFFTGIFILVTQYLEWETGRSAAEEVSEEELKQFDAGTEQPLQTPTKSPEPKPVTSPVTEHKSGEKVASLIIPRIQQKYSVYWGTDEEVLKQGVGMFVSESTTVPGTAHTVLSGHRDTVFVRLGELKENDELLVDYQGQIYTYRIEKIWITDQDDRSVIVPKDEPTLTLTTCYPFTYFGNATERYIIQASLKTVS